MKRKLTIALLALGTIGGFASGIRSLRCNSEWRRQAFEQHVARVCVDAARASQEGPAARAETPAAPAEVRPTEPPGR